MNKKISLNIIKYNIDYCILEVTAPLKQPIYRFPVFDLFVSHHIFTRQILQLLHVPKFLSREAIGIQS
jgi:hypothetical protein